MRAEFDDIAFLSMPAVPGDFNSNGVLDAGDMEVLAAEIRANSGDVSFDLNGDRALSSADQDSLIHDLAGSWYGDANLDGEFNSGDLTAVFKSAKYEQDVDAGWADGDWNGDGRFDSGDMIKAFQDGGYEQGPKNAVQAVPEPTSIALVLSSLIGLAMYRRR